MPSAPAIRNSASRGRQTGTPLAVGSIRHVSILFADIVGSTRIIRFMDAEDARDLLDDALHEVTGAVHAFGGTVARIQGDGVMAVFGMIAMTEDHALRAALAACRMRDSLASADPASRDAADLQIRIGIHSGPILVRWQEDDFGRIIDAVGAAAHVAGQVEQNCPPGSIAISGATLAMIDEPVDTSPLMSLSAADSGEALSIFELRSIQLARADLLPVKGKATLPLVGREAAMRQIRRTIRGTSGGAPLAIVGDAGIGKSRLLSEAALLAEQGGQQFIAIRANAILRDVPFGALVPGLRRLLDIGDTGLSANETRASLSEHQAACLAALLDPGQAQPVDIPPDERNRLVKQAAARLLEEACGRRRMTLLIDDIQYLDIETLDFIEDLCGRRRLPGLSLLLAGRPEATPWFAGLAIDLLELQPLDAQQSNRLVASIIGSGEHSLEFASQVSARSGGLPLALEEFANFALGHPGSKAVAERELPPRLETLFMSRMSNLDADASVLCVHCSALGTIVPVAQLRRLDLLGGARFDTAMQSLIDNRILQADLAGRVGFSHQLAQEAIYRSLGRRQRQAVHTAIYGALAAGHHGAPPLESELARHAEEGGMHEAALGHLRQACEQAIAIAAIETVHAIYLRAKAICGKMGPAGQRHASLFAVMAMDALQQLSREQDLREDMLALAAGGDDFGIELRTIGQVNMALIDWIDGRVTSALGFLMAAEQSIAHCESLPRRVYLELVWGYVDFTMAEPGKAVERFARLTDRLRQGLAAASFGAVVVIPHILALSFGAWFAVDLGQVGRARQWSAEALEIAERTGHNYSRLLARLACGYLELRHGQTAMALDRLREAHRFCTEQKFFGFEPVSAGWLGLALIEAGEIEEARRLLEASTRLGYCDGVKTSASYYHLEARCRLALALGDNDEAVALGAKALDHCRIFEDLLHEHSALVLQAEVARHVGQPAPCDLDELSDRLARLGLAQLTQRLARIRGETAA